MTTPQMLFYRVLTYKHSPNYAGMDVINQVKISMQIYYGRKRHSPRTGYCQSEITKSPHTNNDTEFKKRFAAIEEKLDL
jgi:hypothetical protein